MLLCRYLSNCYQKVAQENFFNFFTKVISRQPSANAFNKRQLPLSQIITYGNSLKECHSVKKPHAVSSPGIQGGQVPNVRWCLIREFRNKPLLMSPVWFKYCPTAVRQFHSRLSWRRQVSSTSSQHEMEENCIAYYCISMNERL